MKQQQTRSAYNRPAVLLSTALLVAVLALQSCGGKSGVHSALKPGAAPVPLATVPAATGQPAQPGALPSLPSPAELAALKASSATDADHFRRGANFKFSAPHYHVQNSGVLATFQPAWNPGGAQGAADMALAVYEFPLDGVNGSTTLTLTWGTLPKDFANVYIGLSSYLTGRWEWLQGQTAPYDLDDIAPYQAPDGRVFVAVAMVGNQSAALSWLRFGPNLAPTASLGANPNTGPVPFDAVFSANGSTDPEGGTLTYDWDFDNDGIYDKLAGGPQEHKVFTTIGDYTCGVRVTDNGGLSSTATFTIHAIPPPGPPVARLQADWVFHDAPFLAHLDASPSTTTTGTIDDYSWDLDNDGVFELDTAAVPTTTLSIPAAGQYTVGLRITDSRNLTDTTTLTITGDDPGYDEIEPNSTTQTAQALPVGNIQGWEGNLGEGGYDGSLNDWYALTVPEPGSYQLDLDFDPLDADLDLELWSADGLFRFTSSDGVTGDEHIVYTFGTAATYYIRALRYERDPLQADYTLNVRRLIAPQATLDSSATSGNIPLPVDFTATASDSDGSIVKYQWDFDGDGIYEYDSGLSATASHTYLSAGTYNATVRVTDNDGATTTAFRQIQAQVLYDEVEDNDTTATAQALPGATVTDFAGNLGLGGANNGDEVDWYKLSPAAGQELGITLRFSDSQGDFDLALYSTDGTTLLQSSTSTDDDEYLDYKFPSAGTYFLKVYVKPGAVDRGPADYLLSSATVTLSETEDNDLPATGNVLPPTPFSAYFGNIGVGGPVDGDESDWYQLTLASPGTLTLSARFNSTLVDLDLRLYGTDGTTQLGQSVGIDNEEQLTYYFPAPGTYYINAYIYLSAAHRGPANYELDIH